MEVIWNYLIMGITNPDMTPWEYHSIMVDQPLKTGIQSACGLPRPDDARPVVEGLGSTTALYLDFEHEH